METVDESGTATETLEENAEGPEAIETSEPGSAVDTLVDLDLAPAIDVDVDDSNITAETLTADPPASAAMPTPVDAAGVSDASGTTSESLESAGITPAEGGTPDQTTAKNVAGIDPEATDSNDSAPDSPVAAPEKLTIEQVDSFETFLRFLEDCDGGLKTLELRSGSGARVALASPVRFDQFDDEIRAIAVGDVKLATALALMCTADKSALTGTPRQTITALAAHVLKRHPAFAADDIVEQRLSSLLTGESAPDTLPRLITRMRNLLDRPFDGKESLKPAALQALQDNALHTAVLIAASAAKWDVGTCIDALADNLWASGNGYADTVTQREKLVTIPRSARKTAGLLVDVARDRLRTVEQERDGALARVEISRAESQRLTERLDSQLRRTAGLEAELDAARVEHEAEVAAHRSERMGTTTDFESLRVDLARTITKQIESLEDALDALEHGQSQITKEFVGRSVNTLRVSLSSLQPRAAHDSQGETT